MKGKIRILQVFGRTDIDRAKTMKLYRNLDRSQIQFDFLFHNKKRLSNEK